MAGVGRGALRPNHGNKQSIVVVALLVAVVVLGVNFWSVSTKNRRMLLEFEKLQKIYKSCRENAQTDQKSAVDKEKDVEEARRQLADKNIDVEMCQKKLMLCWENSTSTVQQVQAQLSDCRAERSQTVQDEQDEACQRRIDDEQDKARKQHEAEKESMLRQAADAAGNCQNEKEALEEKAKAMERDLTEKLESALSKQQAEQQQQPRVEQPAQPDTAQSGNAQQVPKQAQQSATGLQQQDTRAQLEPQNQQEKSPEVLGGLQSYSERQSRRHSGTGSRRRGAEVVGQDGQQDGGQTRLSSGQQMQPQQGVLQATQPAWQQQQSGQSAGQRSPHQQGRYLKQNDQQPQQSGLSTGFLDKQQSGYLEQGGQRQAGQSVGLNSGQQHSSGQYFEQNDQKEQRDKQYIGQSAGSGQYFRQSGEQQQQLHQASGESAQSNLQQQFVQNDQRLSGQSAVRGNEEQQDGQYVNQNSQKQQQNRQQLSVQEAQPEQQVNRQSAEHDGQKQSGQATDQEQHNVPQPVINSKVGQDSSNVKLQYEPSTGQKAQPAQPEQQANVQGEPTWVQKRLKRSDMRRGEYDQMSTRRSFDIPTRPPSDGIRAPPSGNQLHIPIQDSADKPAFADHQSDTESRLPANAPRRSSRMGPPDFEQRFQQMPSANRGVAPPGPWTPSTRSSSANGQLGMRQVLGPVAAPQDHELVDGEHIHDDTRRSAGLDRSVRHIIGVAAPETSAGEVGANVGHEHERVDNGRANKDISIEADGQDAADREDDGADKNLEEER